MLEGFTFGMFVAAIVVTVSEHFANRKTARTQARTCDSCRRTDRPLHYRIIQAEPFALCDPCDIGAEPLQ